MGTRKTVLLVFGIILAVAGFGLAVGGGGALWADASLTDDDGYFNTGTLEIETESYAVISDATRMEVGSWWAQDWGDLAILRVRGSSGNPSNSIFMGVADEIDLSGAASIFKNLSSGPDSNGYLTEVHHHEVIRIEADSDTVEYQEHPGNSAPAPPTTQGFWSESVHGPGTQTLEWEPDAFSSFLVLMNEDASAGLDMSIVLGVKIPWLAGVAVGVLIGGVVLLALGVPMIFLAVRRPRSPKAIGPDGLGLQ